MKNWIILSLLWLFASCNSATTAPPADLIPSDKMVAIWVDIHLADAVADQKFGNDHPNIPFTSALYQRIYQNYHISAAQYKASYRYYETQPDLMSKMYEKVLATLSQKQAEITKK